MLLEACSGSSTDRQANGPPGAKLTIVAASDLKYAMDSLVGVFQKSHSGEPIEVIYGSSGKFFQQIQSDAPFDMFFSADLLYPQKLEENKLTSSPIRRYAIGRIVLWSSKLDPRTKGMRTLLEPGISHIAIANPEHGLTLLKGQELSVPIF